MQRWITHIVFLGSVVLTNAMMKRPRGNNGKGEKGQQNQTVPGRVGNAFWRHNTQSKSWGWVGVSWEIWNWKAFLLRKGSEHRESGVLGIPSSLEELNLTGQLGRGNHVKQMWALRPLFGVCEFKAIFKTILRFYSPFPPHSVKCMQRIFRSLHDPWWHHCSHVYCDTPLWVLVFEKFLTLNWLF